jgi:hypothetical protein
LLEDDQLRPKQVAHFNFNFNFNISVLFQTWSLTVREEHKLRVFENRVLRRIFGAKRDRVTGG